MSGPCRAHTGCCLPHHHGIISVDFHNHPVSWEGRKVGKRKGGKEGRKAGREGGREERSFSLSGQCPLPSLHHLSNLPTAPGNEKAPPSSLSQKESQSPEEVAEEGLKQGRSDSRAPTLPRTGMLTRALIHTHMHTLTHSQTYTHLDRGSQLQGFQ